MLFTRNLQRRQKHEFDLLGVPIFARVWVLRKCKNDCLLNDGADDRGAHVPTTVWDDSPSVGQPNKRQPPKVLGSPLMDLEI